MDTPSPDNILEDAIALAETWQKRANQLMNPEDKVLQDQMMRLLRNPADKIILTQMIDQSFRSKNSVRVADQVYHVLQTYGLPKFFGFSEQMLMRMFLWFGRHLPGVSIPQMIEKLREDTSRSIIPGEDEPLYKHLQNRKRQGVRMNLNHLGEAVLGEDEALYRLEIYLKDLKDPEIEYVSIKISTIYSQINPLAYEHTISILVERLSQLYRAARDNRFTRSDGSQVPKFVNLDMEEYRDLHITAEAFMRTLNQEEFKQHSAGIVLQAYLPDSYVMQQTLTDWAKQRVQSGGAPIKIRIVKGANMETEQVEASLHNWSLAPYDNKLEVDANFKRMADFGMKPENIAAVHLGIASHNLFEQAYAYTLAKRNGVTQFITFEMLEGMANHVWRAIQENTDESVLLYAPVAVKKDFIHAVAYLIRRLDENTGDENFLRHSFTLRSDSGEWDFLKDQFIASYNYKDKAKKTPNRTQNRLTEPVDEKRGTFYDGEFINESDTDWSLSQNRQWAEAIRDKWKKDKNYLPDELPLVIAGKELKGDGREFQLQYDASQYHDNVCVARYSLANDSDIESAVKTAKQDPDGWRSKSLKERHEILSKAAAELRKHRGDLIGAACANTGKIFTESDPEVSEAVDFAEYYPYSAKTFDELRGIRAKGKGVGLVLSPWNFPIAIPCGGIIAALAAGNTVIFKPASAAVLTAWQVCQCFWDAGVSKNTLQFVPCSGSSAGAKLANHPDIDFIILTGGTDTGMQILRQRPGVFLAAETGGKNATIVTAMADRDLAIKNILHSAFGNSGQKCSATSLLILEKEVYDDPNFKKQLADAAKSYTPGSAWEFQHKTGPLIAPPKGDLERAIHQSEPEEYWVSEPHNIECNPYMWSPGIRWGVQPGSYSHTTEFFGPILGVMCAKDFEHAIQLANSTGYGLTSGLESLDKREQTLWKEKIQAGNLYINRGTTGAVVLRQPFGGIKKSALGAGIKAGGPNYVSQFMSFEETAPPAIGAIRDDYPLLRLALEWKLRAGQTGMFKADMEKTVYAIKSYLYQWEQEFSTDKDYFHLRGQDNIFRYQPIGKVVVRVHEKDSLFEVLARIAASKISGCKTIVSLMPGMSNPVTEFLKSREGRRLRGDTRLNFHTDEELIAMMPSVDRIRYASPGRVPYPVFKAAAESGFYIARNNVVMEGRIELLNYFREQSICNNYHRYGNLGERAVV